MITTPDGVNLYTTEEYQTVSSEQFREGMTLGRNATQQSDREAVISVMKDQVAEGSMDNENAVELTNLILNAMGVEEVSSLYRTYSVVVYINNEAVLHLDSVEAEDESDAEQKVQDDLNFDDIELSYSISSNGEYNTATMGDDSYRVDLAGILQDLVRIEVEENDN